MPFQIRVTLSNGETRTLAGSYDETNIDTVLNELESGTGKFRGPWLDTTDASRVARDHVAEYGTVPLRGA